MRIGSRRGVGELRVEPFFRHPSKELPNKRKVKHNADETDVKDGSAAPKIPRRMDNKV
jgi:hypothetical protein